MINLEGITPFAEGGDALFILIIPIDASRLFMLACLKK
jgi:hypothetical protein